MIWDCQDDTITFRSRRSLNDPPKKVRDALRILASTYDPSALSPRSSSKERNCGKKSGSRIRTTMPKFQKNKLQNSISGCKAFSRSSHYPFQDGSALSPTNKVICTSFPMLPKMGWQLWHTLSSAAVSQHSWLPSQELRLPTPSETFHVWSCTPSC